MVTLFSETNYQGGYLYVDPSDGCVTIAREWPKWEGAIQSIQTYGLCIQIYADPDCSSWSKHLELSEPEKDLKSKGFYPNLQSILSCSHASERDKGFIGGYFWLGLFILAMLIALVIIVRLRRNYNKLKNILTEKEIQEFLRGSENRDNIENGTYSSALTQPYNQNYEIPEESFMIDMKSILGSGAFSIVYRGSIKVSELTEGRPVAVKSVKSYAGAEYVRAMLKEIKTMIYVGHHPRIVELVGCYTKNLWNGKLYIITEFLSHRSLDKFFLRHCEKFVDSWNYSDIPQTIAFSNLHLVQWSMQIAEGMEYLASKQVIHGDLATRNVLLDENFQTKISDFGLSRQLYEYTQYVKKNKGPLPWRWLAIESLKNLVFSTESDVWAFGVTIWEIFSLGETPYPGTVCGESFISDLTNGIRLPKPKKATTDCYNLMLSCWKEKPSERITFSELKRKFRNMFLENASYSNYIRNPHNIMCDSNVNREFPTYIELSEV